ncbi:WhiB family transcriptional regulator [Micromonospora haikouensis]|uniref:WhiB family transcriptional regulator n=1 Tax=Micromonospora haikouensis TaxID=686309 RepID=UPI0037A57666
MSARGTRSSQPPDFLDRAPAEAACAGTEDPVFFPDSETAAAAAEALVLYCGRCQMHDECREWALAQPVDSLYGIWAGTTHAQRRRLRRREQAA